MQGKPTLQGDMGMERKAGGRVTFPESGCEDAAHEEAGELERVVSN